MQGIGLGPLAFGSSEVRIALSVKSPAPQSETQVAGQGFSRRGFRVAVKLSCAICAWRALKLIGSGSSALLWHVAESIHVCPQMLFYMSSWVASDFGSGLKEPAGTRTFSGFSTAQVQCRVYNFCGPYAQLEGLIATENVSGVLTHANVHPKPKFVLARWDAKINTSRRVFLPKQKRSQNQRLHPKVRNSRSSTLPIGP